MSVTYSWSTHQKQGGVIYAIDYLIDSTLAQKLQWPMWASKMTYVPEAQVIVEKS